MLALIDGDVIAYIACKKRESPANNFEEEYSDKEDETYFEECWKNFKSLMSEILDRYWTCDYLMAVKSDRNFRNLLYPDYKMNRHKDVTKANKFVPLLRKRAVNEGMAVEAFGCEADDFLRIWAEQARMAGDPYIVVSIDKDLFCIQGNHYNPKTNKEQCITRFEATLHFYEQLLKGDSVDNIPGIPGIGPKKATAALESCVNEAEMQESVVNMYIEAYADSWYDMLLSNGRMLYLSKEYHDFFSLTSWPIVQELLPLLPHKVKKKVEMIENPVRKFKVPERKNV